MDVQTKVTTSWIIITSLSKDTSSSLKFFCLSLTWWSLTKWFSRLLSNANVFISHTDVQTKVTTSWIVITGLSKDASSSLKFFSLSLTWWSLTERFSRLLSNAKVFTSHIDVQSKVTTSWIVITSLSKDASSSLKFFSLSLTWWSLTERFSFLLSNANVFTSHIDVQTKSSNTWIVFAHIS